MGKTKGPPWITGTDQMLSVILDFIDGILPDQHFVVAGESYGGYLARGVIKAREPLVDGLLLICPVADQETRAGQCAGFTRSWKRTKRSLTAFLKKTGIIFTRHQRGAE